MIAEAPRASRLLAHAPAITPDTRQRHQPDQHPGTRQKPCRFAERVSWLFRCSEDLCNALILPDHHCSGLLKPTPGLIYCSITGFGQTGPRRSQAAYDFAIQAMGGLMSITGERDDKPGGGPQKVGVPIIDIMIVMYATVAILAALARRNQTGQGEVIDIAMLDVCAALLVNQGMNHLLSGITPSRMGNCHPNIQPQDVFDCRNGQVVIAVGNDGQYVKLCEAIGRPDLASDTRFAINPQRIRYLPVLLETLRARFREIDASALAAALDAAGVSCATINDIPGVLADPQIQAREVLRHIPHSQGGTVPEIVSPMRFRNAPLRFDRPPPLLGQHTQ